MKVYSLLQKIKNTNNDQQNSRQVRLNRAAAAAEANRNEAHDRSMLYHDIQQGHDCISVGPVPSNPACPSTSTMANELNFQRQKERATKHLHTSLTFPVPQK